MPAILSEGNKYHYNSMIIEKVSLGVSWNTPIFTVYANDERFNNEFMKITEYFTVSIMNKNLFRKFAKVYGT